jgi:hypothetical protein
MRDYETSEQNFAQLGKKSTKYIYGLILKLTAFQHLSIWAFRKRRALRYNLFCGKKSHKKGFPLQSLTQNAVVPKIKP